MFTEKFCKLPIFYLYLGHFSSISAAWSGSNKTVWKKKKTWGVLMHTIFVVALIEPPPHRANSYAHISIEPPTHTMKFAFAIDF